MRAWPCVALLWGCVGEPSVRLDGRPVASLARAAARAVPGSEIALGAGEHTGGVVLPDRVRLLGPSEARVVGDARLLHGTGALYLDGIALVGGSLEEGGAVLTDGELRIHGVALRDAPAEVALRPWGSLSITDSTLEHDGVIARTGTITGRPPRVEIADSVLHGVAEVPADHVDVQRTGGALELRASGQSVLVQDTQLSAIELRSPSLNLAHSTVDGAAHLYGRNAILLDVSGGTWEVDLVELTASGWSARAVAGASERIALVGLTAPLVLLDGEHASLDGVRAAELRIRTTSIQASDLVGERVALTGLGSVTSVTARGAAPQLSLGPSIAEGVLVASTDAPARVQLAGTDLRGAIVVEPEGSPSSTPRVEAVGYANVTHLTWLGGSRPLLAPAGAPVHVAQSIIAGAVLAPPEPTTTFDESVLWQLDGGLGPLPTVLVDDPRFVAPGDPHLRPDSPHVWRGGFAGETGPLVEGLWQAL